jgi:uncharacterized protein YjbI with pentapeptide repeats
VKIKFLDGTEREATLQPGANLRDAYLRYANLSDADLSGADLSGTELSGANLSGANLIGANLIGANLGGANLSGANLIGANLSGANLIGANLYGANLRDANLNGAHLSGAKGLEQQCILPAGAIEGYKKLADGTIVVLHIPADAKRINAYGSRKCRAEFALVVSGKGKASRDGMPYAPGWIYPDQFDPDPRVECSNGIHFFITRQEAEDYEL